MRPGCNPASLRRGLLIRRPAAGRTHGRLCHATAAAHSSGLVGASFAAGCNAVSAQRSVPLAGSQEMLLEGPISPPTVPFALGVKGARVAVRCTSTNSASTTTAWTSTGALPAAQEGGYVRLRGPRSRLVRTHPAATARALTCGLAARRGLIAVAIEPATAQLSADRPSRGASWRSLDGRCRGSGAGGSRCRRQT